MPEVLAQISWHCPTCKKKGRIDLTELAPPNAFVSMRLIKTAHREASPECKVSYPNYNGPHAPKAADEPELPNVYNIAMVADEVFFITMCMYVAQCYALGTVVAHPNAVSGLKHWSDVLGTDRINQLTGKFNKIAELEDMNTILHVVNVKK